MFTSQKAKMWAAVVGATCIAIAQAFPEYASYASVVIAVLTALGVYAVPNAPATVEGQSDDA